MTPKTSRLLLGFIFLVAWQSPSHRPIRGVGPLALPGHTIRLIQDAPIVVVASVLSFTPVGAVFTTEDLRHYPVQLNRISLSVEDVWRGSVPLGPAEVFCFSFANGHASPKGKYIERSAPAGRRIYFLDTGKSELRCFVDIYESSNRVFTGRHPPAKSPARLEEMVAGTLLTPGIEPELSGFASFSGIGEATYLSRELVGLTRTMRLLWPLRSHSSREVRDQACVALTTNFRGQDDCADELIKQSGNDPLWKDELERIVASRQKRDQRLMDGRLPDRCGYGSIRKPDHLTPPTFACRLPTTATALYGTLPAPSSHHPMANPAARNWNKLMRAYS